MGAVRGNGITVSHHPRNVPISKAQPYLPALAWTLGLLDAAPAPWLGGRAPVNTAELALPPRSFQKDLQHLLFPAPSVAPVWCLCRPQHH